MNKNEILKKFKNGKQIKQIVLNYKTNEEIKQHFLKHIKESFINKETNKAITEEEINENFKETETEFIFLNLGILKNVLQKEQIINKLYTDINTTTIKEYDKINGLWFKTDYSLFEYIN